MSYPESIGAANAVLRAAEAWADAHKADTDKPGIRTVVALTKAVDALVSAVDAYRATGEYEQITDPKEPGD